jgi:hypothetical protein
VDHRNICIDDVLVSYIRDPIVQTPIRLTELSTSVFLKIMFNVDSPIFLKRIFTQHKLNHKFNGMKIKMKSPLLVGAT